MCVGGRPFTAFCSTVDRLSRNSLSFLPADDKSFSRRGAEGKMSPHSPRSTYFQLPLIEDQGDDQQSSRTRSTDSPPSLGPRNAAPFVSHLSTSPKDGAIVLSGHGEDVNHPQNPYSSHLTRIRNQLIPLSPRSQWRKLGLHRAPTHYAALESICYHRVGDSMFYTHNQDQTHTNTVFFKNFPTDYKECNSDEGVVTRPPEWFQVGPA